MPVAQEPPSPASVKPWASCELSVRQAPVDFVGNLANDHLLESGESLSGLWIARYLPSGTERKRVLGVPRWPEGPKAGNPRTRHNAPFTLTDRTTHSRARSKRSTLWGRISFLGMPCGTRICLDFLDGGFCHGIESKWSSAALDFSSSSADCNRTAV